MTTCTRMKYRTFSDPEKLLVAIQELTTNPALRAITPIP
jgi:hypothetical protein